VSRWLCAGPATCPPAPVSDHVAYFGDFMATARGNHRRPPAGEARQPQLSARAARETKGAEVARIPVWEFYEGATSQAVRLGNWKGVRIPMLTGPIQLFDLSTDLGEQHEVAAAHPDVVERIRNIMDQAHVPSPLWPVNPAANRNSKAGE